MIPLRLLGFKLHTCQGKVTKQKPWATNQNAVTQLREQRLALVLALSLGASTQLNWPRQPKRHCYEKELEK